MPKSQVIDQKTARNPGFLLIDKPAGMTSHDVVDRVRRLTGERRVGHAGTLDPFATGLLIVGVGRVATREMQKLVGLDKEYEAVFVLGASSTTDDTEGEITPAPLTTPLTVAPGFSLGAIHITPEPRLKPGATTIEKVLKQFIGRIEQIPPTYSAIKVGGKKMYETAREGKPIEGKPRRVTVHSFTFEIPPLASLGLDDTDGLLKIAVTIHCSSGTYIRSLARDLGRALGGGGYVEQLRRTSIGPFVVEESKTLEALEGHVQDTLVPVLAFLAKL